MFKNYKNKPFDLKFNMLLFASQTFFYFYEVLYIIFIFGYA